MALFIWTIGDLIGGIAVGFFLLLIGCALIGNWWSNRKRKP